MARIPKPDRISHYGRAAVGLPAAACLACLAWLAALAWLAYEVGPVERLDLSALRRTSAYGRSHGADLAEYLAHLADPDSVLLLTALICVLGLVCRRPRQALAAVGLVVGAALSTLALKSALAHPRPHIELGAHQIVPAAFPSGHSTAAAAVALALILVTPPAWRALVLPAALFTALAVGVSLVLLGDHFPSDVLGGWLVALAWWFAAIATLRLAAPAARSQIELGGRKLSPPSTRS